MSLREQFVKDLTVVQPKTGLRTASDDLAAALRISPETVWRAPANANTAPRPPPALPQARRSIS